MGLRGSEKTELVITAGGIGGKERIGAGILVGGPNPNDMELVDDDVPEE